MGKIPVAFICQSCGEEFSSTHRAPKFCSHECAGRNPASHRVGVKRAGYTRLLPYNLTTPDPIYYTDRGCKKAAESLGHRSECLKCEFPLGYSLDCNEGKL